MTKKRTQRSGRGASAAAARADDVSPDGADPRPVGAQGMARRPRSISLSSPAAPVAVAMLSKNQQTRVDFTGGNDVFRLGEIYLNELSDLRVFELTNVKARRLRVSLKVELRKPFHSSVCNFQLENENLNAAQELAPRGDQPTPLDEFNHVPVSVVRASTRAAMCVENAYLSEGYNELFNHIATVDEIILEPHETKSVVFSMCTKLSSSGVLHQQVSSPNADSSEEERKHLNETSCLVLAGRFIVKTRYEDSPIQDDNQPRLLSTLSTPPLPLPDVVVPLHGQVCRSLLRLDVKELHFDDCIPGGSFVKDFTVWNRSEIPLLFQLVFSIPGIDDSHDLLTFTDYNSGYKINDKAVQAAAYGHVRIRVTYRPVEVGERFFEVHAQNLHDSRNIKILKIHAVTNKEHHREGLSIKEPNGSYFMSGSKLDFGDCYSGIPTSKTLLIKNATEAPLHVELTSDRPKEVTFELKLLHNRVRASRSARNDDVLSPNDSNDGSSRKGSLSPDAASKAAATFASFDNLNGYGGDSDDDGDDNEGELYDEDVNLTTKRLSFEDNPLGDADDADDDFEFDREPRPPPRSPPASPKARSSMRISENRRRMRKKAKRGSRAISRLRDSVYESGVDSGSICSSPERKPRGELRRRTSSIDDANGSNFLVETLDLPPGVERTILVWYCPMAADATSAYDEGFDSKACRLSKQTFRVSFRCFQIQGSWQQAQSRVYDRTLGKSIHVRARTCTSIVTVSPSILHMGDCNIGELKSSACVLTNHSELPTVVKPLVTSKVISTVPNDDITLGPKQSLEVKVEIIPRKINPNYSRLISVLNLRNRSNIPQVCVRSSNMDAHHVIYHSLFYKLLTPSKSAFLNFDQVATSSVGMQVFDLENITNAPLHLSLQTSDPNRVRLYYFRQHVSEDDSSISAVLGASTARIGESQRAGHDKLISQMHISSSSTSLSSQSSSSRITTTLQLPSSSNQSTARQGGKTIRRRRSFGCEAELNAVSQPGSSKRGLGTAVLKDYLSKKGSLVSAAPSTGWIKGLTSPSESVKNQKDSGDRGVTGTTTPPLVIEGQPDRHISHSKHRGSFSTGVAGVADTASMPTDSSAADLQSLLDLFDRSRAECDRYCHLSLPNQESENEIVAMIRERVRKFQALQAEGRLVPLTGAKDRNVRIPAKSKQRIVAVFTPYYDPTNTESAKLRVEKCKIFITLPPGGNKKAVADGVKIDPGRASWAIPKHPFDSRPSVRELLVKCRVCRSVLNVNQKNINFGRITVSSRSSKKLIVQNMSSIPLVYSVEKTGSISSAFLEIKDGEVGVVKSFGTKEISFEFQPTLAGPFEEKLKIVNVQDPENSLYVTIKARVVKRETFKLLQSGQVLSFGKCLVGEKSELIKIAVRNTSRKRREYAIQLDPTFSNSLIRPTVFFAIDDTPSMTITQAQEKKLDEELEKLEHKLRIAVTKKKTDKITKLNAKITRVRALLSGEQVPDESNADDQSPNIAAENLITELYDSNSESEFSEAETSSRNRLGKRSSSKQSTADRPSQLVSSTPTAIQSSNMLQFTLDPEAVGRVVAYAIFHPVKPATSAPVVADASHPQESVEPRSQRARKRQLKRDLAPLVGVGKLLLFEQQNKDVVKELQFNAEVFLRTPAGESAYYRGVGKAPLPPVPHPGLPKRPSLRKVSETDQPPPNAERNLLTGRITDPTKAQLEDIAGRDPALSEQREYEKGNVTVKIEQNQVGLIRHSTLMIPVEEHPGDTLGWVFTLTNRGVSDQAVVELRWLADEPLRGLLTMIATVRSESIVETPRDKGSTATHGDAEDGFVAETLPLKVRVPCDHDLTLHLRWMYAPGSGFGSNTPITSSVNSSILDALSRNNQASAGTLEIATVSSLGETEFTSLLMKPVEVALVKAAKRTLHVETLDLDLGQEEQNGELRGQFIVHNRSRQSVKYLLLTSPLSKDASSTSSIVEISFDSSTGKVDPSSQTTVHFSFRCSTPGQHSAQILVRNLSDRLETLTVNVTARITRPVYVRIPELDPLATGTLNILDLGACYVTPEMQDTSVDSPNVSLKFSKTHKLTLLSQVSEDLILSASSNLKTQCYVYEDSRLYREATHVTLSGKSSLDLYVALRPRLPLDAFKSGAPRDLVGGIRVQLFRSNGPSEGEDKSAGTMVAEFTIKFVGVAGASLSRVNPSLVEFKMEPPSASLPVLTRTRTFEITNVSKALPLQYRLFVSHDTESYSDYDTSLVVNLLQSRGDIPPGESGQITFSVTAKASGLFRRRILVENLHYAGKIMSIDVVVFVENSVLICEVPKPLRLNFGSSDESSNNVSTCTANLGNVPVIQLEEDLAAICDSTQKLSSPELEGASVHRKYRIYSESTKLLESSVEPSHYSLLLTNTDESADLIVRPVSTLPLCFQWSGNLDPIASVAWLQLQPTAFSATLEQLQRLQLNPVTTDQVVENQCSFFYGGVCSIPAKSSRRLHFRFAPIAASDPLPVDTISSGRPHALRGLIAVQNFASGIESSEGGYARTLRAISLHGQYAESNISVCETSIALGKIGYSLGWRSSSFQVVVRNVSDISTFFAVGSAADSIVVTGVRNAMLTPLRQMAGNDYSASLLQLAAATTRSPLWKIEPFAECVIEMKFVQTPTPMTAGLVEFPLRIHNLLNPHNVEQVLVSAQIVSSYAEITVDPESSGGSIGVGHDAAEIGYLPPVTVPPLADSTGTSQGPSFWFSVKNVFDEELSVTVSPRVTDNVKSVADLLICSRSSNTLMSSVTVAPGESIDIRVVCRVKSSARISTSLFGDVDRHYNGDLLTFGSVDLDITVQNMKDAAQHKEILVRGKVVPGRTFSLSASNLHFYAVTTDVPPDMPLDQFPSLLRMKTSNRDQVGALDTQRNLYQLRTQTETFWIKNPSATQPLNFAIDQVPLYSSGLCIISGSTAEDMCAMSEHIQAVPVPSSGSIPPGESVKVNVRLEEVPALNCTDVDSADPVSASSSKSASMLHKMRHHPSWRSNSWGGEMSESASEPNAQSHMFLSVRDVDLGTEAALAAEIDVLLVLQPSSSASGSDTSKPQPAIDKALLGAAFATREKRLQIPKMTLVPPSLPSPVSDGRGSIGGRDQLWGEGSVLDHFDEFDIGSIRSGSSTRQSQLPVLTVRGCTPAEHSTLHSTRYVIDVGQHTVRNGGEVEWEITIECAFNQQDSGRGDSVDYRLLLVDRSANSWFQLSRDRGTLDSTRSYQSVVMYFYRDVVGVYSTFLVLQNVTNPGDLKVIQVKLEVVADLSSLRSMTSGIDPAVNLFRVLVSSQSVSRKLQRSNIEYAPQAPSSTTSSASSKLIVDYGEVYYHKLYHNHSIVIENASSMALDFMLSSSAQNEISFSVSPTSFSEVTTVTLPARGRAQVFLHFRPRPDSRPSEPSGIATEYWSRELEVYVNCRLVKDFRETVVLRAICYPPQLVVDVASSAVDLNGFASAVSVPTSITQPNFLGMVFAMTEAAFTNSIENAEAPETRYLVVKNTRSDVRARIALRNDSLFFSVSVDSGESTQADSLEVDYLEDGICAGRRSTLLVSIAPQRVAVFSVVPDLESLRKHRQMWDHSIKEHITLYNIKQFAEHYQVTLCFTSSNVTSYYIPPHIVESYPFSALEDTIAKFLQNYHATWKWLISYHSRNEKREGDSTRSSSSLSATRLADVLSELEAALEQSSPLSPRKPLSSAGFDFDAPEDREALRQLLHSYRALYFDFFYITDELIWYGVRSNAVRQSLMLADLAYGVVFNHEIFRAFVTQTSDSNDSLIFPRLLLPWSRQLRHFLSFFPENQEAIRPLRQLYEQLQKFELLA